VAAIAVFVPVDFEQRHYEELFKRVQSEFDGRKHEFNETSRGRRYEYQILTVDQLPTYCSDAFPVNFGGIRVWIDGYGYVMFADKAGVYIGVRSWIQLDGVKNTARVIRIYHFVMGKNGWRINRVVEITQRWRGAYGWICK
jgi:hypothetical protein